MDDLLVGIAGTGESWSPPRFKDTPWKPAQARSDVLRESNRLETTRRLLVTLRPGRVDHDLDEEVRFQIERTHACREAGASARRDSGLK
jgi:hypothetical protein